MTKRKFSKLLNKEAKYTAIKKHISKNKEQNRILLLDVKYKNKLYADHVWILRSEILDKIPEDTEIEFIATAYMYNDKYGVRKQGLDKCRSFRTKSDHYNDDIALENLKYMKRRKG